MIDQLSLFGVPIDPIEDDHELPEIILQDIDPQIEEAIAALREIKKEVIAQFQIGTRITAGDLHGEITGVIDEMLCMVRFDGELKPRQVFTDSLSIEYKPVLVEKEVKQSLPEQGFAISVSNEAILGISDNFKPVVMPDSPIIDESYIKGFNVGDRVRFRDGYSSPLEYEYGEGVITDKDDLHFYVIWHGESDSDRYSKSYIAPKQWWEKLDPVIDAAENIVFEQAIATEPTKSVANLRMDEGKASVLVESDRYQFLLERREQLIESGACPDGIWINCCKVPNRDFKQAVWKSDKPRPEWGDKKSRYIGKFGGDEHLSAIAQHRAGQELRRIEREIKKLQVKS